MASISSYYSKPESSLLSKSKAWDIVRSTIFACRTTWNVETDPSLLKTKSNGLAPGFYSLSFIGFENPSTILNFLTTSRSFLVIQNMTQFWLLKHPVWREIHLNLSFGSKMHPCIDAGFGIPFWVSYSLSFTRFTVRKRFVWAFHLPKLWSWCE